tara:strand:+ start:523 stop:720 length:198 start_codon:yes stop_codon:yes gene_type:complete
MKKLIILSNNNKEYVVNNPENFLNHLKKYHSKKGKGDNSIHEENGYYFTVTNDFYKSIVDWFDKL